MALAGLVVAGLPFVAAWQEWRAVRAAEQAADAAELAAYAASRDGVQTGPGAAPASTWQPEGGWADDDQDVEQLGETAVPVLAAEDMADLMAPAQPAPSAAIGLVCDVCGGGLAEPALLEDCPRVHG